MILKSLTSCICLQISEVVNSMKDLIDFSRDNSVGPIGILLSVNTNRGWVLFMLMYLVLLLVFEPALVLYHSEKFRDGPYSVPL